LKPKKSKVVLMVNHGKQKAKKDKHAQHIYEEEEEE
jgi:hypothetical protein